MGLEPAVSVGTWSVPIAIELGLVVQVIHQ